MLTRLRVVVLIAFALLAASVLPVVGEAATPRASRATVSRAKMIAAATNDVRSACRVSPATRRCRRLQHRLAVLRRPKAGDRAGSSTRPTRASTASSTSPVRPATATTAPGPAATAPAVRVPAVTTPADTKPFLAIPSVTTAVATTPTAATLSSTPDVDPLWKPLGEPGVGGRITALAVSPFDPQRVLAGGDMLGIGLSTDGGATWQGTFGLSSWEINDFTWDATNPMVVWAGTMSGPYRSDDGGRTWTSKRAGMPTGDYPYSAPIQKLLIDPSLPGHMLAVGGNHRRAVSAGVGAVNLASVYESADGGDHWANVGDLGAAANVLDVVAERQDLRTLDAVVLGQGVQRSTDGGRTWSAHDTGLPHLAVNDVTADPSHPGTLWAALDHSPTQSNGLYAAGGVYKTTDGGAHWLAASTGLPQSNSAVAVNATGIYSVLRAGDGVLYTADQGYLTQGRYVSTDDGQTWSALTAKVSDPYSSAATPFAWASSADGTEVFGGTFTSIIKTADRGASWTVASATRTANGGWKGTGYSGLLGTRVAFDPQHASRMFLTAFDSGNVLRTDDSGASWTRPTTSYDKYNGGYDIAVGGSGGSTLYAVLGQQGLFNGIATSTDGGLTWRAAAGGGLPARGTRATARGSVAVASADGSVAYAILPSGQLYTTSDTGMTWRATGVATDAWAVAVSPDFKHVWVGTDHGVLARTVEGGFPLVSGSPAGLHRLVLTTSGEVYGTGTMGGPTARAGLWRFAGGQWIQLFDNRFASDVAIDPTNPDKIVVVTNDNPYHTTSAATGVWLSSDRAASFRQINRGLAMPRVYSAAFDPNVPGRLVVGTNGGGFWQTHVG